MIEGKRNGGTEEVLIYMQMNTFKGCTALRTLDLKNWKGGFDEELFNGCETILEVILLEGPEVIKSRCFQDCRNSQKVIVPNSVKTIEANAFRNCTGLEQIVIPKSVTDISDSAFDECKKLVIATYEGTIAESYAKEHNIPIEYLKEDYTDLPFQIIHFSEANIGSNNSVKIISVDGTEKVENERLGSKDIIQIKNEAGEILEEYTVVVPGDVTGNGYTRMYDAFQYLKQSIAN